MKTKIFFLSFFLIGLLIAQPVSAANEKRNVREFEGISLRVPGTLYLEQGNNQEVEIEANQSTLDEIITEVENGKLIIRFPTTRFFWRNFNPGRIVIHVTVPEINSLAISGSGDIIAQDKIETRNLDLSISGSGDIKLDNLEAVNIKSSISGSGDINIEGGKTAENFTVNISGSGSVNALDFSANQVEIKIAGSGDTSIEAIEELEIRVAGSGDVYYRGNPDINSSVAGSGNIKKVQ